MAGELNLSFDMRVNLGSGIGAGSAHDPLHQEWNIHFAISSVEEKMVRSKSLFTMRGTVTDATIPAQLACRKLGAIQQPSPSPSR